MAYCYPRGVPQSVLQEPPREADVKVYRVHASLPESFRVFSPIKCLERNRCQAQDGEADFMVTHPDLGLLVVEVKGEDIAFDAERETWVFTSSKGSVYHIRYPIGQARQSKHALLSKLRELPGWHGWMTVGHSVAFSDVGDQWFPSARFAPGACVRSE